MKKKLFAIISSMVITLSAAAALPQTSAANPQTDTIRILPIGDSITHGYINGDNGYRKYFQYYLNEMGITNFDMVGPNNSWSNSSTYDWNGKTITYDPQHAGYSGYAIQQIPGRSGIRETVFDTQYSANGKSGNMLEVYDPNVVMLQIGTNDLLDCALDGITDRLESLVDLILPYVSDAGEMLYLASVPDIDYDVRTDWLQSYQWKMGLDYSKDPKGFGEAVQKAVDDYNAAVKAIVDKKQAQGEHIMFSDINSVVDMKAGLEDGCHPNEKGYASMGKHWADLVGSTYFNASPIPVQPTIETTTIPPTTAEPTTAEPTTIEPTTVEPTTAEPETEEPEHKSFITVALRDENWSEVAGAQFQLISENNLTGIECSAEYVLKDEHTVSWVSGDTPVYIGGLTEGDYTVQMITAPDGYAVSEEISFRIFDSVVFINGQFAPQYDGKIQFVAEKMYTVADLVGLCGYIIGREERALPKYDTDGNGRIDSLDAVIMRQLLIG